MPATVPAVRFGNRSKRACLVNTGRETAAVPAPVLYPFSRAIGEAGAKRCDLLPGRLELTDPKQE